MAPAHLETAHPLLDDHTPDELEAVPEIEVMTRASFPPSVRDPDIVVVPARVFERRPTRATAADVVLVVEIVSPGSRGTDHVMKLHEYAKAGIANFAFGVLAHDVSFLREECGHWAVFRRTCNG